MSLKTNNKLGQFLKYFRRLDTKQVSKSGFAAIAALIMTFGILGVMPVQAAGTILVDDLADIQYNPALAQTNGINNTTRKTLRWAIEKVNRECDGTPTVIQFDYANMKAAGGAPAPLTASPVTDSAGVYTVGADKVFRLALNSYLPPISCPNVTIDGKAGNPNTGLIGQAIATGVNGYASTVDQIQRPAIEIYPKSNYVDYVTFNRDTGRTPPDKPTDGMQRCGLHLSSTGDAVRGIAIFGFGGGGINDGNICLMSFSSANSLAGPDPAMTNPNVNKNGYFPGVQVPGYCINGGTIHVFVPGFTGTSFGRGTTTPADANGASCGTGHQNYLTKPNIASNRKVANTETFSGNILLTPYTGTNPENAVGQEATENVSGATATLLAPGDVTFGVDGQYDTAKAIAMRSATYHTKGSGIIVIASDKGLIKQNITAFNGGNPGAIASSGSQAGILFDRLGYGTSDPNAVGGPNLNAEGWIVEKNETYLNINNDRGYGGHGIFTNLAQNGTYAAATTPDGAIPAEAMLFQMYHNHIHNNGGAGIRTFVPAINIVGNKIYENGEHTTAASASEAFIQFNDFGANGGSGYAPLVSSFKHGIYLECGDGFITGNQIYDNPGSSIAIAGANMKCPNGGQPTYAGNTISVNEMYNNGNLGIDHYLTSRPAALTGTNFTAANFNFEKPIGVSIDNASETQNTGGVKFVTLNQKESIAGPAITVPLRANDAINFPVFSHVTKDCATQELTLHGWTSEKAVVEVFTPDKGAPNTYDGEGKSYKFNFSDDDGYVADASDTNTEVSSYTNDDVKDPLYLNPLTGIVTPVSLAGPISYLDPATGTPTTGPVGSLDKVKTGDTIDGLNGHEFSVKIPTASGLKEGSLIVATATDYFAYDPGATTRSGVTSEFSPNFLVNPINLCRDLTIDKKHGSNNQDNNADPASVDAVAIGTKTSYEITVTNKGPDANPTSDIVYVTDKLDAQLKLEGASGPGWTCTVDAAANSFVCARTGADAALLKDASYPPITVEFTPLSNTPLAIIPNTTEVQRVPDTTENRTKYGLTGPGVMDAVIRSMTAADAELINKETNLDNNKAEEPVKPLAPQASIVKKWTGTAPTQYEPGDTLNFEIIVTNEGTIPLTSYNVTDDNFAGASEAAVCTPSLGDQTTAVAVGASQKFVCTAKVLATATGTLKNTAILAPKGTDPLTIVAPLPANPQSDADTTTPAETANDDISVPPSAPKASIVKKWTGTAPAAYLPGDTLNFEIIVTNEGKTPLTSYNVTDDNFAGASEAAVCTPALGDQTTAVAVGASQKFVCTAKVLATATGTLKNTAILAPKGTDPLTIVAPLPANPQSDADTTTPAETANDDISVPPAPAASIVKKWTGTAPVEYAPGDTLNFEIIVTNEGTVPLKSYNVTDDNFAGASEAAVCTPALGDQTTEVAVGASQKFVCTAKVLATATGTLKNTAILAPKGTDPLNIVAPKPANPQSDADTTTPAETANDDISVPPQGPKASIVKKWTGAAPTGYKPGDTLNFEIIVTNEGKFPVTSYNVTDDNFAGASEAAVCTPALGDQAIAIAAGASQKFVCTAKVLATATGTLKNTAILAPKGTDPLAIVPPAATNPQSDADTTTPAETANDDISVPPTPAASIVKRWTGNPPVEYAPGDTLNFEITVTNEGTIPLKSYKVTDDNFAGATEPVVCTPALGDQTGELAPAASQVFKCTAKVLATATGKLKNTATLAPKGTDPLQIVCPKAPMAQSDSDPAYQPGLSGQDGPCDKQTPEEVANDDISVNPVGPKASIVKKWTGAAPVDYAPGDTLNFEIIVTNEGKFPVTSYNVTDDNFAGASEAAVCTPALGDQTTEIAVGASQKFTCTAKVLATATGALKNTAILAPKGTDPLGIVPPAATNPQSDGDVTTPAETANDDISVPPQGPKASIVKKWTGAAPVEYAPGDTFNFEIIVTNEGKFPVTSYNVTDDNFGGASEPVTCTPALGDISAPIAVGSSAKFTCTTKALATAIGAIKNTATLAPKGTDPLAIVPPAATNPQSDGDVTTPTETANDDIIVPPVGPKASIVKKWKDPAPTSYKAGDTLNFQIIVTNEGKFPIADYKIEDDNFGGASEPVTCTPALGTFTNLAVGASTTLECTAKIKAEAKGELVNTATLSDPTPTGKDDLQIVCPKSPMEQSDKECTPLDPTAAKDSIKISPMPKASIIKAWDGVAPESYKDGDTLKFTITVYNEGEVPVTSYEVKDDNWGGVIPVTCVPPMGMQTTVIPVGGKSEFKCSGVVPAGTTSALQMGAQLDNKATLVPDPKNPLEPVCPKLAQMSQSDATCDPKNPETVPVDGIKVKPFDAPKASIVKAWKEPVPTAYNKGDKLSFTITVTNEGTSEVKNYTVSDDSFASASNLEPLICSPMLSETPAIPVGGKQVYDCYSIVKEVGDSLVNSVTLGGDPYPVCPKGPMEQSDKDCDPTKPGTVPTDSIKVPPVPQASIVKKWTGTAPVSYVVGDTLSFEYVVTNEGKVPVTTYTVADDNWGNNPAVGPLTCNTTTLPEIPVGGSVTVKCTSKVVAITGDLVNTAVLDVPGGNVVCPKDPMKQSDTVCADPNSPDTKKDSIPVPAPKASIIKKWNGEAPTDVKEGDVLKYDIFVKNEGTVAISKLSVADDNFGGYSTDVCTLNGSAFTFGKEFAANLAVGAEIKISCTATIVKEVNEPIVNTTTLDPNYVLPVCPKAPMSQSDKTCDPTNPESVRKDSIVAVPQPLDISVVKTVAKGTYAPGDVVNYKIVVTNNSKVTAPKVTMEDTLPKGLSLITVTKDGAKIDYTSSDTGFKYSIGDMKAGESVTFEVMAKVGVSTPQTLVNEVKVSTPRKETNYTNNQSKVPVTIVVPRPATPRTGGQVAVVSGLLAFAAVAYIAIRKRVK
ncbi:MAG: DUF7507 domain-containing protein [Patescibacteria group bacterium]